jgi:hypothetical protein
MTRDDIVTSGERHDDPTSQQTGSGQPQSEEAKRQAQQTAEHARGQAGEAAGTAKAEGRKVADDARHQARNVIDEAKSVGRARADEQAGRLADALRQFNQQTEALLDGRTDEAGALGDYARQLADRAGHYAQQVDDLGFDGVVRETSRFARRRPGAFLLAAAGAGLLVGRLGRGAKDAQDGGDSGTQATGRALPSSTEGTTPGTTAGQAAPTSVGDQRRARVDPTPSTARSIQPDEERVVGAVRPEERRFDER